MLMRGQVTIFAIIGFAFLIVVVFSLSAVDDVRNTFRSSQRERILSNDYTEGIIRNTADHCLDAILNEALIHQGMHAGYISAEAYPRYNETGSMYYKYYEGNYVPVTLFNSEFMPLSDAELMIRACRMTVVNLETCFTNADYAEQGFIVSLPDFQGNFTRVDESCDAFLKDEGVALRIRYPITLSKGSFSVLVADFAVESPIQIKRINSAAAEFASRIKSNSEYGSYNLSEGCADGYETVINDETGIISLVDISQGTPFLFRFAIDGYSFEGEC